MGKKSDTAHIDSVDATLAARLRKAMTLKAVNANQVEIATGITRQAIYLMLKGTTEKPSWPVLVKLCEYLGVRPEWLADGELPMYPAPVLDDDEIQLIEDYRTMSRPHQKDIRDIATRWAEEDAESPSKGRPFRVRPPKHQQ